MEKVITTTTTTKIDKVCLVVLDLKESKTCRGHIERRIFEHLEDARKYALSDIHRVMRNVMENLIGKEFRYSCIVNDCDIQARLYVGDECVQEYVCNIYNEQIN